MTIFKITGDLSSANNDNPIFSDLSLNQNHKNKLDTDLNEKVQPDDFDSIPDVSPAKLLVVGIGGCGGNVIQRIYDLGGEKNIDCLAINTDVQDLKELPSSVRKIKIGDTGLGAGGIAEAGRMAAMSRMNDIQKIIEPYDAIFLAAGLGGGTGSGAAPAIAQMIAERGDKLLVVSVTEPFEFEGRKRQELAKKALAELERYTDSLIVVPNDKIMDIDENLSREEAFRRCDQVLGNAINSITYTIQNNGTINVDFNDVKEVLKSGPCQSYIGIGEATGDKRIEKVVDKAFDFITVNDLENCQANSGLIVLATTPDSPINECKQVREYIKRKIQIENDANLIYGVYDLIEGTYDVENPPVRLFVILSGIEEKKQTYTPTKVSSHIPSLGNKVDFQPEMKLKNNAQIVKSNQQPSMGPLFEKEPKAGTVDVIFSYFNKQHDFNRDGFAS